MPHYVQDPDNPGQHIDVIDLVKRNRSTPPPPEGVLSLMLRDSWTRHEALLILAGYDPSNHVDKAGHPIGAIGAGLVYLDGTTDAMLSAAGLHHPLSLVRPSLLSNYLTLTGHARGEPVDERKPPQEWLAWAESKGFTPYWLDYWREHESGRSNVRQGETAICGQELLGWDAAQEERWNVEPIDYKEWIASMEMLSASQAARLMAGLNPERFADLAYAKDGFASEAKSHARRLERLAAAANPPKERDTPAGWLAWADSRNEKVHSPFRVAVECSCALQAKRAAGRFTIEEAAQTIAENTGERPQELQAKLMQAVAEATLPVFRPGEQARYIPKVVRTFYEEAYWDDLNAWLQAHEPRITWRFPAPKQAETQRYDPHPDPTGCDTTAEYGSRHEDAGEGLRKRERQIRAIENIAKTIGYDVHQIPDGGKRKLMERCKSSYPELFGVGDSPFNDAWKEARRQERVRMKNHEKFVSGQ